MCAWSRQLSIQIREVCLKIVIQVLVFIKVEIDEEKMHKFFLHKYKPGL